MCTHVPTPARPGVLKGQSPSALVHHTQHLPGRLCPLCSPSVRVPQSLPAGHMQGLGKSDHTAPPPPRLLAWPLNLLKHTCSCLLISFLSQRPRERLHLTDYHYTVVGVKILFCVRVTGGTGWQRNRHPNRSVSRKLTGLTHRARRGQKQSCHPGLSPGLSLGAEPYLHLLGTGLQLEAWRMREQRPLTSLALLCVLTVEN